MSHRLFVTLALAATLAACSSTTPSGTTATIKGSVVTPASASDSAPASGPTDEVSADTSLPPGLVVTVVGSKRAATLDSGGAFTLTGVPAGTVVLRFHGPGVDSTVTITGVQGGQSITLVVSITNGSAGLESDEREGTEGGLRQLEGRVEAIPPVSAVGTFVVDGKTVTTDASTVYTGHGSSFADLVVGVRVHVSGTTNSTGILAATVNIQNTNATLPVNVNGIVQAFTGTVAAFSFTVDGTIVQGDATTAFQGNSAFANLANGKRVEVKGLQGNGFVTATSIHVNPH